MLRSNFVENPNARMYIINNNNNTNGAHVIYPIACLRASDNDVLYGVPMLPMYVIYVWYSRGLVF